ncbi:prepilin peptidase [Arthrobacter sp. MPF02]|uniref:prepilin peptidase n=1 Tax=Arthrobacter sp. MPF02 TaxID=3388492 RepID=UPI0039847043
MSVVSSAAVPTMPWAAVVGLLCAVLCPAAELLIARFLPRLGTATSAGASITTSAITGILCTVMTVRVGFEAALPAFLALCVLAVQLARIDLAMHLLPNPLVVALLGAGTVLLSLDSALSQDWSSMARASASAAALFFVYLVLAVISPSGIGMGDVKLAAPLGMYLGYMGWSQVFYGGALGFVLGGLVSAGLVAAKVVKKNAEIAFGPSMLAAALGTILTSW